MTHIQRLLIVATIIIALIGIAFPQTRPLPTSSNNEGAAQGMTSAQADAILNELRSIRKLLEIDHRMAPTARAKTELRFKIDPSWPSMGREDAPLTLVEFNDYQCPFCKRFYDESFAALKKEFIDSGLVKFVVRDFPLSAHPDAALAAEASRCAGDQGKYWELHSLLMNHKGKIGAPSFIEYGEKIQLKLLEFESCLQGHKHKAEVQEAALQAQALTVSGTPSFVLAKTKKDEIVGEILTGALPFGVLEAAIKKELESSH